VLAEWDSVHSQELKNDSIECFRWWEALEDATLNSLVERAVRQNLDVQIAMTRIFESRLAVKGGQANLLPHVDATTSYSYASFNQRTLNQILGYDCCQKSKQRNVNLFEVGFDAEWEIDLFGMAAFQNRALKAMEESSQEDFSNVLVTLTAEVARSYIELRGLQQRLCVIDKNIISQKDTQALTLSLIGGGFAGTLEEMQSEEELGMLIAQRPQIEYLIHKNIYRLSILLGHLPGDLFCELSCGVPLPELPCYRPVGIPSELLRRRPDIRKAERDLAAATEQVGVAIAALFPRISLTGFIGEITTFCSGGGSLTGFVGPQVLMPIFNSRLLKQDVCLNKIKAHQAALQYQKVVLEAFEETEGTIAAFHYELERNAHLERVKIQSEQTYLTLLELYRSGLRNYLEVQVAHRSFLAAESAYLQGKVDLLVNYISLYKALGGGWEAHYTCEK
jgi:NodT family efflux transporter outer membrane factor (OMF) lipoprotein